MSEANSNGERVYEFDRFRLDAVHLMLYENDRPVSLAPKVVETLLALIEKRGEVVSKDELMDRVWADTFVEESNLTQNIYRLRKTLGKGENGQHLIQSFKRRGYRFNGDIHQKGEIELLVATRTKTHTVTEEIETQHTQAADNAARSAKTSRLLAVAGLGVVVIVSVVGLRWFGGFTQAPQVTPGTPQTVNISQFTTSGNVVTATISPDGKYVAVVLEREGKQSLSLYQTAATASNFELKQHADLEFWGVTFSNDSNFIYYVAWERNQSSAELFRIAAFGGATVRIPTVSVDTPVSFSPDGSRFAYSTAVSTSLGVSYLKIANEDGSSLETLIKRPKPDFFAVFPGGVSWSPDGTKIAFAGGSVSNEKNADMGVFLADVNERTQVRLSAQSWNNIGRTTWLAGNSGIIISANDKTDDPHQVWFVTYPSGTARRITNDLHDYESVSATSDAATLAAVQTQQTSGIWVLSTDQEPKQIFAEVGVPRDKFAWTPNGQIVFASRASGNWDIFIMDQDGANKRQLTNDPHDDIFPAVSPDGEHIFFVSNRSGTSNIWKMEINGGNPLQFTNGENETFPECSQDGKWLVFQQGYGGAETPSVWRAPAAGGESERLTRGLAKRPAVSVDGKMIAYVYMDDDGWGVRVMSLESRESLKSFRLPSNIASHAIRWTRDNQAIIAYVRNYEDVSNIWIQSLDGGAPRQFTHFNSGLMTSFDWSPAGKTLAFTKRTKISDVVLIKHFR